MADRRNSPDPVDVQVGQIIRTLRIQKGFSQSKLADALGITFQQVQKYEKGFNRCAPSRLAVIAKMFNVQVSSLFGENGKGQKVVIDPRLSTRALNDLVDALVELNDAKFVGALLGLVNERLTSKR